MLKTEVIPFLILIPNPSNMKALNPILSGASQFGKNKRRNIIREVPSRIMWEFNLVALPLLAQIQN
jgi:hypothetical protein